jgi:cystathionine beta-synthase
LSGAIRYLHSPSGQHIAQDPNANVIIILPDGVRNYMSKPWFLETAQTPEGEDMRSKIKDVIGRDMGDVSGVVLEAQAEGKQLENGEGLNKDVGKSTLGGLANLINPVALAAN